MLGGMHFQLLTVNSVNPAVRSFFDSSSDGIIEASPWSSLMTGRRHHRWLGMQQNEGRKASNMFP